MSIVGLVAKRKRGLDSPEKPFRRPAAEVEKRVGQRIKELRGASSQSALGERIGNGVSQTTILRWESGHGLTLENLELIAAALGIPLPSLVSDVEIEDLRSLGLIQQQAAG